MCEVPASVRTIVIVPAFNEEQALPGVLAGLRSAVPQLDTIVIDDGSTDGTSQVCAQMGVPVVRLPFNLGIGGALRTGFRFAIREGYERAVQFDGDGQHEPQEIPELLHVLDNGADMVVGSRFATASVRYDAGFVRSRAMGLLRFVVRQSYGGHYTDTSSGFRAFSAPVLKLFSIEYPAEYLESVEALALALARGYRVDEVPVKMSDRSGGRPSTQGLKLPYHYLRLMVVLTAMVGKKPPAPGSAET